VEANNWVATRYFGNVDYLVYEKRAFRKICLYVGRQSADLRYELPMNEVVMDFF